MEINAKTQEAYDLMHAGALALSRAELAGIRVDVDYVKHQMVVLSRKINRLENEFKETTFYKDWVKSVGRNININSDEQLAHYLYNVKGIKPPKLTKGGSGATDKDSLKQLNIPELDILIQQSKIRSLRDTNLDGYLREQVDGYIHPVFNVHLPVTYRSSSDHPNFQNQPIRDEESMNICRGALYPRPGHLLLEIDFKGIEVSVNACYNHDPALIKYQSDPGTDMHADMTKQIFKLDSFDKKIHKTLRKATKNGFVFPQFYGDYFKNNAISLACEWGKLPQGPWQSGQGITVGDTNLADLLIKKGIKEFGVEKKVGHQYICTGFLKQLQTIEQDFWTNRFPEYKAWKERWYKTYLRRGYIDLLTGFRCSGVMSKNDVTNYPAQGSAFHCLLWSFIQMDNLARKEGWDSRLIGQIHDSMLWDVLPSELDYLVQVASRITSVDLLKHFNWICVPMKVDMEICGLDQPWSTKKDYEYELN
jgi:DNA polymerase I-like protein with 3'-5' exonuclease and polymerase domains